MSLQCNGCQTYIGQTYNVTMSHECNGCCALPYTQYYPVRNAMVANHCQTYIGQTYNDTMSHECNGCRALP